MLTPIRLYPEIRLVNKLPPFPKNRLGLERGSYIHTYDPAVSENFGLAPGHPIPLCFDGTLVRCQNIGWRIDHLVRGIEKGIWLISDKEPIAKDTIPWLEQQMGGGQVTVHYFWEKVWPTQKTYPKLFMLPTIPDVTAADLKASAKASKKALLVHSELHPADLNADGTSAGMKIAAGDTGSMSMDFLQHLTKLVALNLETIVLSGNKFYVCQLAN